jgi:hypothetical protein
MNSQITKAIRVFSIGDRVRIVDLEDKHANVQSITYSIEGYQFQISYWHDNIRRVEWVFPSEIESLQK